MPKVLFINGPNLNMLGIREKEFYGYESLEDINAGLRSWAEEEGLELEFFQSNHEGDLVDRIQQAYQNTDCIVINPGAFTHYSIAICDALKSVQIPVIEVHISNIYARETFRSQSLISPLAVGGIFGFGPAVYQLALQAAGQLLNIKK
ncbi:MAG: type II 3-dehydroquinate dehydratase [Syntrophomonas sp.]|nr:type II 3-dehydroquinate dehydratase [Syntrophomonas sp.]